MTQLDWRLVEIAFAAGVLWIRDKIYRKDLTGVAGKTRDLESKRLKALAVEIELHSADASAIKRLARHLHDTV
jgi:hypothetical protein